MPTLSELDLIRFHPIRNAVVLLGSRLPISPASKYMRLSKEIPEISNDAYRHHFDSLNSAIAYLSASEETKVQVDQSSAPVTKKQINQPQKI